MTNKKFKLAAMSLATAVAVSTVGPSASAVTYQLEKGDVTVGQDDTGAYSYQNQTDGKTDNVYVDQDTQNNGQIIITQAEGTKTDNTVTVEEDVTNDKGKRDVDIILDGVNVNTSTQTEVSADNKEDKTIIKVGEGADVDLTVKDSNLTTGGNGIDIGVNLKDDDDNKETNVDLTLDNTKINLTEKDNTAGIVARDNSKVDVTLKGENTIDGEKALEDAAAEKAENPSPNRNVEGIRVGGENAGDDSKGKGASLTIKGDENSEQGSLEIDRTYTGMVISDGSDVTLTDNADVDINNTEAGSTTQGGRGIVQRGDLAIEDNSSLTIDKVTEVFTKSITIRAA